MSLIMPPGTLATKTFRKNIAKEINVEISHEEPTIEIEVITLSQYATRKAKAEYKHDRALKIDDILKTKYKHLREFVLIDNKQRIVVGINRSVVSDDDIAYAMSLLFRTEDVEPNSFYEFGDKVLLEWI